MIGNLEIGIFVRINAEAPNATLGLHGLNDDCKGQEVGHNTGEHDETRVGFSSLHFQIRTT